jgi:hypothetical protein
MRGCVGEARHRAARHGARARSLVEPDNREVHRFPAAVCIIIRLAGSFRRDSSCFLKESGTPKRLALLLAPHASLVPA